MVKRIEIIYEYSGFQDLCFGCNKSEVEMRGQGFYGDMSRNTKSIYLTVVKMGYDSESRPTIKGEFYCQNCAIVMFKEMNGLISLFLPPESGSPQITKEITAQAHEEFKRLWWESKYDKKLK